jgi:hypothetical protein
MELRQLIFAQRKCRLVDACREMRVQLNGAHDASKDAQAAALLLQRYFDLLRGDGVHTLDRLTAYGQRAFMSK